MINVNNKEKCCGCSACQSICPVQCIAMVADEEGFLYPQIDQNLCIGCDRCSKVCPMEHPSDNKKYLQSYISYAKSDIIRDKSSSGGIFTILAEHILSRQGIICGAAFSEDFKQVKHLYIDHHEQLELLRGSKYTQSIMGDCFLSAKKYLDERRLVLFVGTGCQIAGLKSFLGKDYPNLYTIDILCHGVPSPKLWKRYVEYRQKEYNSTLSRVSFREKSYGWKNFAIVMEWNNGKKYEKIFREDAFMKLFLSDICLRPSCHRCPFKDIQRVSDITIGDSWGIEKHSAELFDDKGASVVLIHSQKGEKIFDSVASQLIIKPMDVDIILPASSDSRRSVEKHRNRARFFRKMNEDAGVEELLFLLEPTKLERMWTRIRYKIKGIFAQ